MRTVSLRAIKVIKLCERRAHKGVQKQKARPAKCKPGLEFYNL